MLTSDLAFYHLNPHPSVTHMPIAGLLIGKAVFVPRTSFFSPHLCHAERAANQALPFLLVADRAERQLSRQKLQVIIGRKEKRWDSWLALPPSHLFSTS